MKATQLLHDLGQSIWLDNITRDLLDSGTLEHYINELSVTGLTSNPTIFDHAIKNSTAYDEPIGEALRTGKSGEALFFELALDDITRAEHGELGAILPAEGGDCEQTLAKFAQEGIDIHALAARLQDEGAKSFVKSWDELMAVIEAKTETLQTGG